MHAIKVLEEDHARIEALLEELAATDAVRNRAALFEKLADELTIHAIAEDNVFFPHVEEAVEDSRRATAEFFEENAEVLGETEGLISSSYEGHRRVEALLEVMEGSDAGSEGWEEKRDELRETVELQIEREGRLFSGARLVLEEEDFERIGDLIEHCKGQVRGLTQAKLASSSNPRRSLREDASLLDLEGSVEETSRT